MVIYMIICFYFLTPFPFYSLEKNNLIVLQFTILFFKFVEYLIPPCRSVFTDLSPNVVRLDHGKKNNHLFYSERYFIMFENCNLYQFGSLSDHVITRVLIQGGFSTNM